MVKITNYFQIGEVAITALLLAAFVGFVLEKKNVGILTHIILCFPVIPLVNTIGWLIPGPIARGINRGFDFSGEVGTWISILLFWLSFFSTIPSIIGYPIGYWVSRVQK
jgi:hypothetical protein